MKQFLLIIAIAMAASFVCATVDAQSKPATYRPQVGEPHPDFVLPRIDNGKPLQLSDFRGKKILLVHFASW